MCGVFGFVQNKSFIRNNIESQLKTLFELTEPRGRQASGLALAQSSEVNYYKRSETASKMMTRKGYKRFLDRSLGSFKKDQLIASLGHCRLVTDGTELNEYNNQPIAVESLIGIHNGVINNYHQLAKDNNISPQGGCDTEVLLARVAQIYEQTESGVQAFHQVYSEIEGAATTAVLFPESKEMVIATNFGSLYAAKTTGELFVFASERKIISDFLKKYSEKAEIQHFVPAQGARIDLATGETTYFNLDSAEKTQKSARGKGDYKLINLNPSPSTLKKCKRCILPETYPFLRFDSEGICSQCRKYEMQKFKGKEALHRFFDKYRSKNGEVDCLVGLSGGRDSSFGLHVLKEEFGMNPVGFSYDWLLTSQKARHNISKMAAALGVEVIYRCGNYEVQAKNIRDNIYGFLKDPDLGMMTFVQAGDKEMYHYGREIRKEVGLDLTIWCSGYQLEQREFFIGYCGIDKTLVNNPRLYDYGWGTKAYLAVYYGLKTLKNPSYWNRSIFDNFMAFWHCFVAKDDFLYLFNYYPWSEKEVEETLNKVYDWEADEDYGTNQWRMDDFHTCFINYVYYTIGGFSEFDDFRSNQIREGLISRDEALKLAAEDNKTRYESLRQFSSIVGFNLEHVLKQIDALPKLYE